MRGAIKQSVPYLAVILVTLFTLFNTYGLWQADLSSPIQNAAGDSNIGLYIVKALKDNSYLHNDRVGAPFGLDYNDMHQPDLLHFCFLKALVSITGNILLTLNLYYLLGFVLIALSAFYVMRRFQYSFLASLVTAELYAFTPSHLFRSISHLFLSEYYLIPLVVLFCVQLMTDLPSAGDQAGSAGIDGPESLRKLHVSKKQTFRLLILGAPLAVLAGAGGVYYAFYSVLFVCASAFCAGFRPGRKAYSAVGFGCAVIIILTVVAGMLPILQYRKQHGPNLQAVQRTVVDTEVFSLKLADLYLPAPFHPVKEFRELSARYNSSLPLMNENESEFSSLGVLGAIGFTALLLLPLLGRSEDRTGGVIGALVILNLLGLLYAMTEGFGTLFSFLITPEIRCNNRLIFFIAFFSLAAFGYLLDRTRRMLPRLWAVQMGWSAAVTALLLLGLYDEGTTQVRVPQGPMKALYDSDDAFIKKVDSICPAGGRVLQLPYQAFPEIAGPYRLSSYEPLRAYLHSNRLAWSYPTMKGRPADQWIRELSSSQPPELLKKAVFSEFCGILLDRNGYSDAAAGLETQFQSILRAAPLVSSSGELSFFSIQAYSDMLRGKTTPAEWRQVSSQTETLPRVSLVPVSGFYEPDVVGGQEWRWCKQNGVLALSNTTGKAIPVTLTGRLTSGDSSTSLVVFHTADQHLQALAPPGGNDFRWDLMLKPGTNQVGFNSNAAQVVAPADPRTLYFRMEKLKLSIR